MYTNEPVTRGFVVARHRAPARLLAMDGVLARGRDARKVRRRTNSHTPPRPRHCTALGPGPQDPCPALKSGAARAISPGNPSLCRSSCPSSPPSPPGTSSGRHRSAGSAEALPGTKMRPFAHLIDLLWNSLLFWRPLIIAGRRTSQPQLLKPSAAVDLMNNFVFRG